MRLDQFRRALSHYITDPAASFLAKIQVSPDGLTWAGFVIMAVAAWLVSQENLIWGGVLILLAGLCDMLDGALARKTGKVSRFGAILDSTLDRAGEGVLSLGIMFLFLNRSSEGGVMLAGASLLAAQLVSYIRARAETQGVSGVVGIFTRVERVIVLAVGLLVNQLEIALGVILVLSLVTIVQRLIFSYKQTKHI